MNFFMARGLSRVKNFFLIRKRNVVDRGSIESEFLRLLNSEKHSLYSKGKLVGIALNRATVAKALLQAGIFDPAKIARVLDLVESEHIRTMQKKDFGSELEGGDLHTAQVKQALTDVLGARAEKRFSRRALKVAKHTNRYWKLRTREEGK